MAKDKKSFILYCDQQGLFSQLPDDIAGKLIKHIYAYVNDENPKCEDLLLNIAFEPIKLQLKRDLVKYDHYIDKQRVNGLKGGRPNKPKETQETQAFLDKPKKADNDTDTDTDNDIKVFIKPTVQQIKEYMAKKEMSDSSERFYDFYQSKGWMVGKNKMKDWKAAVRTWKTNNLSNNSTSSQQINKNIFSLKNYE